MFPQWPKNQIKKRDLTIAEPEARELGEVFGSEVRKGDQRRVHFSTPQLFSEYEYQGSFTLKMQFKILQVRKAAHFFVDRSDEFQVDAVR